ncbi:NifB/NifX family molybdenum-iron cluster-binding protein, partial [Clostridium sp.]
NGDLNHVHGNCSPIKAIKGEDIDIVVVNGIGQGAINGLNNNGIKVFKAVEGTIGENLKAYSEGRLVEFSRKNACNHEGCSH